MCVDEVVMQNYLWQNVEIEIAILSLSILSAPKRPW
jgi:hypothetical protein